MTAYLRAHVHPVTDPTLELEVEVVARQGSGPAWYRAHDRDGITYYLPADQTEYHPRHGDTIRALLVDPHIGQSTGGGWSDMDTAPRDGSTFLALSWHSTVLSVRWIGAGFSHLCVGWKPATSGGSW